MAQELLRSRLKEELPAIGRAIDHALRQLPPVCQPVATHVINAGGKRLRPFLTIMCGRMAGYSDDSIYTIAASMELLHAATLLHDDVLDQASTRRGHPAAHLIYGVHDAILAGDALLALGNLLLARTGDAALSRCYAEATMATAAGEILEMASLRNAAMTSEEYLEIARGKTAWLMAQACALGALAARAHESTVAACRDYGENLGIGFQLVDDVLDFAPESQTGKPSGGDLREGKLTPPLRLYRDGLPTTEKNIFNQKFHDGNFNETDIASIVQVMTPYAGLALQEARAYLEKARKSLASLPVSDEKLILAELAEYVGARSH